MPTSFVQVSYMRSQKSYKKNVMFIVSKVVLLHTRYVTEGNSVTTSKKTTFYK